MTPEDIKAFLKSVKYPGFSRDIISFGLVQDIILDNGNVSLSLNLTTSNPDLPTQLESAIVECLTAQDGIKNVNVELKIKEHKAPSASGPQTASPSQLQNVKHVIAVASGKGGVGKSTVAVNLACALDYQLRQQGKAKAVGILDCDIYGPSVPLMMGAQSRPEIEGNLIQPVENFGISIMSMGFLVDEDTPVVWRGPMVMKTIQQFATNVNWGELEVLVVDLPPGTGDAQLSLVQTIPLTGAVIVTTPQSAAVNVAKRGAMMFPKVNVPFLGVIENMTGPVFGEGGGQTTADALGTELLGQIPLDPVLRQASDHGIPAVIHKPDSPLSATFLECANSLLNNINAPAAVA